MPSASYTALYSSVVWCFVITLAVCAKLQQLSQYFTRARLDHSFGCAQAGSGAGGSKPSTQGKNLSPGLRGEQHCENCGALSEPSIVQKLARR